MYSIFICKCSILLFIFQVQLFYLCTKIVVFLYANTLTKNLEPPENSWVLYPLHRHTQDTNFNISCFETLTSPVCPIFQWFCKDQQEERAADGALIESFAGVVGCEMMEGVKVKKEKTDKLKGPLTTAVPLV